MDYSIVEKEKLPKLLVRFNIRPGYRWDGVDRGNGWEDKIVAKAVDSRYKADLAYQWATADM